MKIYETVVYCGRLKIWRVLNVNTGTVYGTEYDSEEEAMESIKDGVEREGRLVNRVKLVEFLRFLSNREDEW